MITSVLMILVKESNIINNNTVSVSKYMSKSTTLHMLIYNFDSWYFYASIVKNYKNLKF